MKKFLSLFFIGLLFGSQSLSFAESANPFWYHMEHTDRGFGDIWIAGCATQFHRNPQCTDHGIPDVDICVPGFPDKIRERGYAPLCTPANIPAGFKDFDCNIECQKNGFDAGTCTETIWTLPCNLPSAECWCANEGEEYAPQHQFFPIPPGA